MKEKLATKHYKKHIVLLVIIVLLIGCSLIFKIYKSKKIQNKTCEKCNIILIDIDILRADALPCYGYRLDTAPNICSFAKKSILFKDNYASATWTLPSIFSTITSLYPTFHHIRTEYIDKLSPEIPTLAETLKKEGYQTAFVGSWINDPAVLTKNNDGVRGYDVVTDRPIEQVIADLIKNDKPWFIHYYIGNLHMPYLISEDVKPIENIIPPKGFAVTHEDFRRALNIYLKKNYAKVFQKAAIEEYGSIISSEEETNDTRLAELLYELNAKDKTKYLIDAWKPLYEVYMSSIDVKNASDTAYLRMMYDTNIKVLDEKLSSLLKQIDTKPLSKNTVAIIMSDHGENFGEHEKFNHESDHHSELFYTPLIIHSPSFSKEVSQQPTSNMDIFPTILDLVGIKQVEGLQGYSLLPIINNKNKEENYIPRPYIASEDRDIGIILQNKKWLYFLPSNASNIKQSFLYNKEKDPEERINIGTGWPLAISLYNQASTLRSYNDLSFEAKKTIGQDAAKLDPKKIERLKKEGYF